MAKPRARKTRPPVPAIALLAKALRIPVAVVPATKPPRSARPRKGPAWPPPSTPGALANSERARAEGLAKGQTLLLGLDDLDSSDKRVERCMRDLRDLLATPTGREAYLRLRKSTVPADKELLKAPRGQLHRQVGKLADELAHPNSGRAKAPLLPKRTGRKRKYSPDDDQTIIRAVDRLKETAKKKVRAVRLPTVIAAAIKAAFPHETAAARAKTVRTFLTAYRAAVDRDRKRASHGK